MSISKGVERLACTLAAHVRKASLKDPILVVYLAEIGTMSLWSDLNQWEDRVKRFQIDRETRKQIGDPLFLLAESIFDLGCYNLHSAIQAEETKAEFERVTVRLREAGVADLPGAEDFDFRIW
jgi:hypothetical protein